MKEPDTKYKGKILYFYIAEQKNPSHVILEAKNRELNATYGTKNFNSENFQHFPAKRKNGGCCIFFYKSGK